jgi:hypothetical protein
MIKVSIHACERFVERVLELKDIKPSKEQIKSIEERILSELAVYNKRLGDLPNGEYRIRGEYIIVLDSACVTTIKVISDQPRYNGGVMRSGQKIKKNIRSKYHANIKKHD